MFSERTVALKQAGWDKFIMVMKRREQFYNQVCKMDYGVIFSHYQQHNKSY